MPIDFEATWNGILAAVAPGSVVRTWSAAKGYTGGSFRIDAADSASVTVSGAAMQAPRRVSKRDFSRIFAVWDAYAAGNFPRARMLPMSQNSTYILSILHAAGAVGR